MAVYRVKVDATQMPASVLSLSLFAFSSESIDGGKLSWGLS